MLSGMVGEEANRLSHRKRAGEEVFFAKSMKILMIVVVFAGLVIGAPVSARSHKDYSSLPITERPIPPASDKPAGIYLSTKSSSVSSRKAKKRKASKKKRTKKKAVKKKSSKKKAKKASKRKASKKKAVKKKAKTSRKKKKAKTKKRKTKKK